MLRVAALALLYATQLDPTAHVIPLAIPAGTSFVVEHSDTRTLAEGGSAVFHERSQISFVSSDDALIASTRSIDRRCSGPQAICDAFAQLGARIDGRIFRFRIGLADRRVTLLDAMSVPLGTHAGDTGTQVAAAVAQSEIAAPGAILAADLRQLLRFADVPLPAAGETMPSAEGNIRLVEINAAHARVAIERVPRITDAVSLHGSGDCRINRANGLVEACRFVDWVDDNRTTPIRIRETRITPLTAAVP
jgi:hypothetical protein